MRTMEFGRAMRIWGVAVAASLALMAGSLSAQTTGTSSWVTGNGDWGTLGNWSYYFFNAGTGASGTSSATMLPGDRPSGRTNVRFDEGTVAHAITLSTVVATHSPNNETWVESFTVANGTWDYYLTNGAVIDGIGGGIVPTKMVFGEGNNTVHVGFHSDNANSKIYLNNLTLAGSGNSIGTAGATINFNNVPVVTSNFNTLAVNGTGNVFRVSNGSTFNNLNVSTLSTGLGSSNSRIEIDGPGAALSAANVDIQGTVGSESQVVVTNGGTLTSTTSAVGTGGKLVVDGAGSKVVAGNGSITTALAVTGSATIQNQATASLTGFMTVTGTMTVSNATLTQRVPTTNGTINKAVEVAGRLDVTDGAVVDIGRTSGNPYDAGLTISASGVVALAGASQMTVGSLAMDTGAQLQVTGTSTFSTRTWQPVNAQGISVQSGSTFKFDKLEWTTNDQEYTLSHNGEVTWGNGGSTMASTDNVLRVGTGTTLKLTGGNYAAGLNGNIIIDDGGTLVGTGSVTGLKLDGGLVSIGNAEDTSGQSLIGDLTVTSSSTLQFDVFTNGDYDFSGPQATGGDYDRLDGRISFDGAGTLLTIDINVVDGVVELYDWQIGDRFQFMAGSASGQFAFDFGSSVAELAARGLMWDTSHFASDGYLEIAAVPEPSTWALLVVGAAVFLWRRRLPIRLARRI